MKGIFVINSLSGGGAEKVFSKLMKMIDSDQKRQHDIEVIILDEKEELYSLPESITI
ncbi:glycosyltransferase family 4 protein, partial [Vibrio ponticus]